VKSADVANLAEFVVAGAYKCWRDLAAQDLARGGSGQLQDTALLLQRRGTQIILVCDFTDDARTLTAGFDLPEPLPLAVSSNFLLVLHDWLEQQFGHGMTRH
jgi:hypothetical protein